MSYENIKILDGSSFAIHQMNYEFDISILDNDFSAEMYLRFFCGYVWDGEISGFWLVDSVDSIPWKDGAELEKYEDTISNITPIKVVSVDDKAIKIDATVLYSGVLFHIEFEVDKNGVPQMLNDTPISSTEIARQIVLDNRRGRYRII